MGLAFGKRDLLERLRPYKVRPSENFPVGNRFQHGTAQHELLAGFLAAVEYVESLGWEAIVGYETQLGQRFLDGLPDAVELYGLRTMEGRVPTFAFNLPGRTSEQVAVELAAREIAVWWGDYYAIEIMKQLGLEGTGAVRAGLVHYNTADEVDRLLAALAELA
jgi:selenocysteine lyase/cysteine desulfurase